MKVIRISTVEELADRARQWDSLTQGVPFRSWSWTSAWWKQYGDVLNRDNSRNELYAICVVDNNDSMIGVAPWYLERSLAGGRIIRFLGQGEACPDYLSVLTKRGLEDQVAGVIARWMVEEKPENDQWDLLELTGVDAQDETVSKLAEHLRKLQIVVDMCDGPDCWRLDLSNTWEDYLARLSKSHRKQIRRAFRDWFDSGRAVHKTAQSLDELQTAMALLIDLHQRRRHSLGETGCFGSERFEAFHRDVAERMFRLGNLDIHWLELDGKPAAIEYDFIGNGIVYAYQSGFAPTMLDRSPGFLMNVVLIKKAIEKGYLAVDFLRGDEAYKPHFRATPRPSVEVRAAARNASAQLRQGIRLASKRTRKWIMGSLAAIDSKRAAFVVRTTQ